MSFALIALVLMPVAAGALRLVELAGGPPVIAADPRLSAAPAPVVIHIVSASLYAVLGAFQFAPALRRRHPGWHRRSGPVVVVLGLTVAVSALWMTVVYAREPGTDALSAIFRVSFGAGIVASIILGVVTIRAHDVSAIGAG